ncbi:MAG: phospho-sugar mutase [Oscillospiraceae bacterium]|jgi:phosphoglucomutase|nr:phospho-sugar mutase [Oscillospiraceae bacterium]
MDIHALYTLWTDKAVDDPDLKEELLSIAGKDADISDRFYRELEFGTGGLRGVIGAGTNRMNVYTVRKATQGMANYLLKAFPNKPLSVAIGFDSRIKSDYFSREAAATLAANGIKAYIYPELIPTPMVSFAVRRLGCDAGINVTASHNPSKFNGYKAYGADGCQMTIDAADAVLAEINALDIFTDVKTKDFDAAVKAGEIATIDSDVNEAYYAEVKKQSVHPELPATSGLKVVYTPLNGAGNKPVRRILSDIGIKDVIVVPEQENPDGKFPTCPYPNPEIREALQKGLDLCDTVKPDLLLATDPDCDRVGIAVPDGQGGYALFSGNETGAMLLEYVIKERIAKGTLPKNPVAVKSLVSTALADKICAKYGVELRNTLTGFKFIGEQIGLLEANGEEERFVFGFEESYGYLAGSYVRDKDAVIGSMLICEMAAYYRSKGVSLIEARKHIYDEYGYYLNGLDNFAFEGAAGMEKMKSLMNKTRESYPKEIAGYKVTEFIDYENRYKLDIASGVKTNLDLPASDVLELGLEGANKLIVRPSGTEPKIKIYYTAVGTSFENAADIQGNIAKDFKAFFLD